MEWEKFVVTQKRSLSGCIPAGYEMLIRAAQVEGVDFSTFQDEYDLDKDRQGEESRNNFLSVAQKIQGRYPYIHFVIKEFQPDEADQKLDLIEEILRSGRPVLVALPMEPLFNIGGWHIMPVIGSDQSDLMLFYGMNPLGIKCILKIPKGTFIFLHQNFDGGKDIAYLK